MEIVRRSERRRRQPLWLILGALAVTTAAGAGYVLQSMRAGSSGAVAMPESGFDLNYVPSGAPAPHPRVEAPRSSLVGVIGGGALANGAPAAAPAAAPSASSQSAARSADGPLSAALRFFRGGAQATAQWGAMLASPAKFLVGGTNLGSANALRRFLADPRRTAAYAGHPLVQQVLDSPTLVGLLLRPSIARAFVGSPAMNDDGAVDALLKSPLTAQVLRSPGVQQALSDNADSVQALVNDPQVLAWLGKHPAAVTALGQVSPAFAALGMMSAAQPQAR